MIDVMTEQTFPLKDVPVRLEGIHRRTSGRRVSIAAVYRWALAGLAGVKLETVWLGGTRATSLEALARFIEASTAAREGRSPSPETCRSRERRQAAVAKELDRIGV